MTLQEIVERLEAATGADRELDAEIALAAGYECFPDGYGEGNSWIDPQGNYLPRVVRMGAQPPKFTASVDAALTLVPEGMRRRVIVVEDGRAAVQLCWPDEDWPSEWGRLLATEYLALCAAALRARMAMEEGK